MSPENINKNLLDAIKKKLPVNVNLATTLMDELSIGKEAVYRRIRGEVAFTFYEAALITGKLGISLDKIVGLGERKSEIFELKPTRYYNLRDIDYEMFEESLEVLKLINKSPHSEFAYSCNIFPQYPTLKYDLILRFLSFKWAYLNNEDECVLPFSEVIIPERFNKLVKEIIVESMNTKNTYYIWDNIICQDIVNDIKYFSNINLISQEDIQLIKKELFELMDELETIAIKGRFSTGNKVYIYVTYTNFDTTYAYICSDNIFISLIGAFNTNYITALDEISLKRIKGRIQSLKKISTQISESGEIQRIEFFDKQRKILNTI